MSDLMIMQNMNQNYLSSSSGFGWLFFHKLFWGVLLPRMTILEKTTSHEKTQKSCVSSCFHVIVNDTLPTITHVEGPAQKPKDLNAKVSTIST